MLTESKAPIIAFIQGGDLRVASFIAVLAKVDAPLSAALGIAAAAAVAPVCFKNFLRDGSNLVLSTALSISFLIPFFISPPFA